MTTVVLATCVFKLIAHPGVGIVMDSKQNVFYTDLKHVWKIDKAGKRTIAVQNVHTHELYLDKDDNLFGEHLWYEGEASDKWKFYVWKFTSDGKTERVVPTTEGFPINHSFVRDEHHMFVAHRESNCQQILKKDERKTLVHSKGCFKNIRWFTRSQNGNLYLIDGPDLKKVDPDGNVETLAPSIAERNHGEFAVSDQHAAMGLWTDNEENVYVAIYGARLVKKVTPDKKVSELIYTRIRWSPTGGFLADNGDLWLLEASPLNEVRVEQIKKSGQRIVYD